MTWVIDAGVALKWFLADDDSDRAVALLESGAPLWAPELLVVEVVEAARRLVATDTLSRPQYEAIAAELGGLFDRLWPLDPLVPRAAAIADRAGLSLADAVYLALAQQEAVQLVTADGDLLAALDGTEWGLLAVPLDQAG